MATRITINGAWVVIPDAVLAEGDAAVSAFVARTARATPPVPPTPDRAPTGEEK